MRRMLRAVAAAAVMCGVGGAPARADVKIEEKSKMKLEGVAGRVLGVLGGKSAKEGAVTTVAVKGDRKLSTSDAGGELVDLKEEKVYRLDPRSRTYEVVTFAELRKRMEDARDEASGESEDEPADSTDERDPEMELVVDVKETGAKKSLNGFDTRQVIVTVTARRKGSTLEQGGGTVFTSDMWLAREVKGRDEIAEFDRRYYTKLYGDAAAAAMQELAAVLAAQPGLGTGMEKLRASSGKLEGFPILTTTVVETVKSARELEQERAETKGDEGGGSLGGMFARAMAKKVTGKKEVQARKTVLTAVQEVLSVSSNVAASDVALPAGYRAKK